MLLQVWVHCKRGKQVNGFKLKGSFKEETNNKFRGNESSGTAVVAGLTQLPLTASTT